MKPTDFFNVNYQKEQTSLGSTIYLFHKKNSPITIRAVINAGSRFDTKEGLAHFVEHMLVAGTKQFNTKDKLSNYLEKYGGSFSALTNLDFIRITVEIAEKIDIKHAFNALGQILMEPLFDPEVFEKEKKTIVAELRKKKSNPSEYVWEVYRRLFFQNTELSKSTLGTEDSINAITIDDIREFKEKYIVPANIDFIIAGDVEMSEVKSFLDIKSTFTSNNRAVTGNVISISNENTVDLEVYDSEQVNFVVGFRTIPSSSKAYVALNLLLNFLAIGRSSQLIKELRYKRGLIYSLTGYQYTSKDWSTIVIQSMCSIDSFEDVISILKNQLLNLSQSDFTQEVLEDLKSRIKKSLLIKLQTSQSWVQNNEIGLISLQESITVDDFLLILDQISIKDIFTTAKEQLIEEHLFIALCGPKKTSL